MKARKFGVIRSTGVQPAFSHRLIYRTRRKQFITSVQWEFFSSTICTLRF